MIGTIETRAFAQERTFSEVKRLSSAGLEGPELLRRAATTDPAPEDIPGVLTLDRRGYVLSHTPSAERLLSELEDLDPFWREGAIPIAARMVVNTVRRTLAPGPTGTKTSSPGCASGRAPDVG